MRKSIAFSIAVLSLVAIAQTTGNKLTVTVQNERGENLKNALVQVMDSSRTVFSYGRTSAHPLTLYLPGAHSSIHVQVNMNGYQVCDTSLYLTGTATSLTVRLKKGIPASQLEVVEEDAYSFQEVVSSKAPNRSGVTFKGNRTNGKTLYSPPVESVSNYNKRDYVKPGAEYGRLTAGEIHDFSKWELWKDMDSTQLFQYRNRWQLHPQRRFAYQLTNQSGFPVVDRPVYLIRNGDTLWQARTDNTGKAELWDMQPENHETTQGEAGELFVSIYDPSGDKPAVTKAGPFEKGVMNQRIDASCEVSNRAEIAFVVDATGSMQDEIDYIKQDLLNIVDEMSSLAGGMDIKTGAVFYKCIGENYVTQTSPLTGDLKVTRDFVRKHNAEGGGLEAVEEALQTALDSLQWSDHARTRILFLVLDEPPGYSTKILTKLHYNVRRAAKMGIRIIPVVSSGVFTGSDKSLEYLMRSMALLTNGTYVFLTDDSGIGNKHTAPTTDSYKTEKLNDIFRRLIGQYVFIPACPDQVAAVEPGKRKRGNRQEGNSDIDSVYKDVPKPFHFDTAASTGNWVVYPVPTSGGITIELPEFARAVYLTDLSGKLLMRADRMEETQVIKWDIGQFAEGIYFVQAEGNGRMETRRVILAR